MERGTKESLFVLTLEEAKRKLLEPREPLNVIASCTLEQGVERWTEEGLDERAQVFESNVPDELGLWVPASGAATRMFASVRSSEAIARLWEQRKELAFGELWEQELAACHGSLEASFWAVVNDGELPKALVPFHRLEDGSEEHALAAHLRFWSEMLGKGQEGHVRFTVQEDHCEAVGHEIRRVTEGVSLSVALETQDPDTDTPVLLPDGTWLSTDEGDLFQRPGGHGALLANLSASDRGMVVIRNIDNAPSPAMTPLRVRWTQAMVVEAQRWSTTSQRLMDELNAGTMGSEGRALSWLKQFMHPSNFDEPWSREDLLELLARPMRLVGVVSNNGQKGGGPFWVMHADASGRQLVTAQIVESVEFDDSNRAMLEESTHFNPVDMVCVLGDSRNYAKWVDESRHLVSMKEVAGQPVRVLEHPGLWNGAMAGWLTRFVELPLDCFQPVKTVKDLVGRH